MSFMQDKQNTLCGICMHADISAISAGRTHQLRRHMALLGHPVLGDAKYTYGYAKRHPDAAVQLKAAEAEQAMSAPFGVSSEHPSVHKGSDDKSKYEVQLSCIVWCMLLGNVFCLFRLLLLVSAQCCHRYPVAALHRLEVPCCRLHAE